ncbi:MAG TPA: excisionase family DNA-binding protein [Chloroflexota bacterium]|nr:excisionase family DNA-binding protein [Chloroflexota bacterium]
MLILSIGFLSNLIYSDRMGGATNDKEGRMGDQDEYVTMGEARELLGVSNFTIWRMVREGRLTAYQSGTDRRKKLIRRSDLDALRAVKPVEVDTKKAAA